MDDALRSTLMGRGSTALPAVSTFERLLPKATNVVLTDAATKFATHTTYELPCEPSGARQLVDVVHRFTLQRRVAWPLNERLLKLAERKEVLAMECEARLVHIEPGPSSNAGVVKTNRGGYQSFGNVFEDSSPKACHALRDLLSVALSEVVALELNSAGQSSIYAGDEACLKPEPGELHQAYAWFNVNRTRDSNTIHQHDIDRWSAVYFVSDGEPNAPGFSSPDSGQMIFRCGPSARSSEPPAVLDPAAFSHSYMAVAPLPGSMWLFPGSIAHAVMPTVLPPGVGEPVVARVSIGINFSDAKALPPQQSLASLPPAVPIVPQQSALASCCTLASGALASCWRPSQLRGGFPNPC